MRILRFRPLDRPAALAYLIVFGSIVGYTAYQYLLTHTRPAVASSYAYVNPVVAVLLGTVLVDEELTWGLAVACRSWSRACC